MDDAALYEWLSQAEAQNPGALQKMIDAGLFDDRMGLEGQSMQLGKSMWDTPSAEGMRVGGTYVASSPLEHLSNAISKAMGAKLMNDSKETRQGLITQKGGGMEALIRAMSQGGAGQGQPPMVQGQAASPWDPRFTQGYGSI